MMSKEEERKVILEDPKDREILVSLLDEYGEKLILLCDKLNKIKNRANLILITLLLCFLSLYFILPIEEKLSLYNVFLISNFVLALVLILVFTLSILYIIYDAQRNCQLLERNARTISIKLEKVVRITSQIQDHSPRDRFIARLELELRLADAESALEYYKIVNKKDYLPSFLRKFILFRHL